MLHQAEQVGQRLTYQAVHTDSGEGHRLAGRCEAQELAPVGAWVSRCAPFIREMVKYG